MDENAPTPVAAALVDLLDAALPQTQCRRCGYDACRPYADAIARGDAINKCPPGGAATIAALAALTGHPALPLDPAHGVAGALALARVDETWCIGCTLCIAACPVDAIVGAPKRMHTVLTALCTGCELCIPPCPVDCIDMVPAGRAWSADDARMARARYDARQRRLAAASAVAATDVAPASAVPAEADDDAERAFRREAAAAAQRRARARRAAARDPGRAVLIRALSLVLALGGAQAALARAATEPSALAQFSATLDQQWDYAKPAESEQRFRALLAQWPPADPQALIVGTQIARSQGMRRQFTAAHATLDAVEGKLDGAPSHLRVRYLLERGRTFNSSGAPERAVPLFAEAYTLAECNDDAFYAVDAAHMLGIAAPPGARLDWNLKALAMTERAEDARTRRWLAPLYNNIGQTYLERGDYAQALAYFRKALPAYEQRGNAGDVRFARWTVARAQRSLGQLDDAEKIQRALLAEYDRLGEADGYVYEELAEIALARGDAAAAKPWAARAHAALKDDPDLSATEPARRARLGAIAAGTAPAGKP